MYLSEKSITWSKRISSIKLTEKSIVQWQPDNAEICPICTKRFNIVNRKHHCRLCGRLMCSESSCLSKLELNQFMKDKRLDDKNPQTIIICSNCKQVVQR